MINVILITPRENPRRRSVGLQNEASRTSPTGRSLGFSSGGLKGIGQNLDKNSEKQKKDKVRPKIAQNSPFVSLL